MCLKINHIAKYFLCQFDWDLAKKIILSHFSDVQVYANEHDIKLPPNSKVQFISFQFYKKTAKRSFMTDISIQECQKTSMYFKRFFSINILRNIFTKDSKICMLIFWSREKMEMFMKANNYCSYKNNLQADYTLKLILKLQKYFIYYKNVSDESSYNIYLEEKSTLILQKFKDWRNNC